ncbi:hypothetical protein BKA63DRAFT_524851 [Paraphoma chrysanthemicola]|nr:hypothetical protein BKA63DRAFT_524851 [Paraphoma chrysanthemicola]
MKRKFSFNLAPVKVATKDDTKPTPEPTPSHSQSKSQSQSQPQSQSQSQSQSHAHSRHTSKDSISDYSAFIQRRVLDTRTEQELRAACKLILQNFKPSDHGMENTDPKLDFGGLQSGRRREGRTRDRNADRPEPKVRAPTGAPVDLKTALEARGLQQTELTLGRAADAPARTLSSRKKERADFAWLDDRDDKREANLRKSSSTRRKSRQLDTPAAIADAAAAEWMQQQREKQDPADPQARPPTAVRPPSRARSIKENIKGYVFPGSRNLSRAASIESLRTTNTQHSQDSQEPQHSGSVQGWRSWNLRRSTSRSNSRPGTSKGQPEESDAQKKANANQVNLNRELPPLPSLDSWKDNEQTVPEKLASPTSATHIASLMRPQDPPKSERTAANNKTHRRSGSDTLAMQFNASMAARSPTLSKHQPQAASRSKTLTPDSFTVTGQTLVGSSSTSNLGHTRQKSAGSTMSPKMSLDVPNFSRKVSVDNPARTTFSNEVKVSRREEQKSRLKKVFSGWMMRKKENKEDWMHRIEKEGVKEGVMVQNSGAGAPVVRY